MTEESAALTYLKNALLPDEDGYVSSYFLEEVLTGIKFAPREAKRFLRQRCRTVEQLEEYLSSFDNEDEDNFWVENGRVMLCYSFVKEGRDNALSYFEDILDTYETRPYWKNLYGHIGQADEEVKDFIRLFYPGDFKQFLLNYSDTFTVFTDDTVSLTEIEAVKYFQQRLREGREGWNYMNLRGCIGQAPKYIIKFINDSYPEESFLQFLENNSYYFHVDEDDDVYLN